MINPMLVGFDASSLFSGEERESLAIELRQKAVEAGFGDSKEAAWQYFSRKAARNLHVVFATSPVSTLCNFVNISPK